MGGRIGVGIGGRIISGMGGRIGVGMGGRNQSEYAEPSISLYHAKYKETVGTGASNFHDVVGQALKNLGKVSINLPTFKKKIANWKGFYGKSKIARIRTLGTHNEIISNYKQVLDSIHTLRNIYLVVSFVSKKEIRAAFQKLKEGKSKPHVTQLAWLLSAFIGECQNVGARPFIICKP